MYLAICLGLCSVMMFFTLTCSMLNIGRIPPFLFKVFDCKKSFIFYSTTSTYNLTSPFCFVSMLLTTLDSPIRTILTTYLSGISPSASKNSPCQSSFFICRISSCVIFSKGRTSANTWTTALSNGTITPSFLLPPNLPSSFPKIN